MDLNKPLPVHHIKEADWVMLRLLYLILAIDPTMARVKDVQKAMRYIDNRYKNVTGFEIVYAFNLLKKEHGKEDTFNQIGIGLISDLQNTVDIHREYVDEETKEFMQRRVFGLSKQQYSSGVIQDIVDKINLNIGEKK
jgi:hypothetical protein